jgi:hypothetical protein
MTGDAALLEALGALTRALERSGQKFMLIGGLAWRNRDRADVERLLMAHRGSIDLDRVRDLVRQFAESLGELERIEEFESLVRRVYESG